jgi:antitoxin ParD1/3/4
MSKLERITVTMPEEMVARLRAAVETGQYATTSEVVREALRDWSEEQGRLEAKRAMLRREIEKGLEGPFLDGPDVMADLLKRVTREAKKRGAI